MRGFHLVRSTLGGCMGTSRVLGSTWHRTCSQSKGSIAWGIWKEKYTEQLRPKADRAPHGPGSGSHSRPRLGTSGMPGQPSDPGPWGCLAGLLTSVCRLHCWQPLPGTTWEEQEELPCPWVQGPDPRGGGELGPRGVLGVEWCLVGLWDCVECRLTCVHQRLRTTAAGKGPGAASYPRH